MKTESAFKLKELSKKHSKDLYSLARTKLIEHVGDYVEERVNKLLINSFINDNWYLPTDIRISLKINLRKIFINEEE